MSIILMSQYVFTSKIHDCLNKIGVNVKMAQTSEWSHYDRNSLATLLVKEDRNLFFSSPSNLLGLPDLREKVKETYQINKPVIVKAIQVF